MKWYHQPMSSRPRLLPKRFRHFTREMPKAFGCKKQCVVIQGQKHVPWPLDHGELGFALHPASWMGKISFRDDTDCDFMQQSHSGAHFFKSILEGKA